MRPDAAYARGRLAAMFKYAAAVAGGVQQGMIDQAFRTNESLGNPSNVDAPAVNATLSNTPTRSKWVSDTMSGGYYDSGEKAAAETFKTVAPPKPPQPAAAGRSAATPSPKPAAPMSPLTSPVRMPIPAAAPPLPPTPAPAVASSVAGAQLQQAVQSPFKLGDFRFGLTPDPKPRPGEIEPTNGRRVLGTNFDPPDVRYQVSQGFEALKAQKNLDLLNAGNEAFIGSPGV